jgi:hypothetical protein
MSKRFYLTFGQKYSREAHPSGMPVHPDAIVEVHAETYDDARRLALVNFGQQWAFLNEWDDDIASWYPAPSLVVIKASDREQLLKYEVVEQTYADLLLPPFAKRPLLKWFGSLGNEPSWRYPNWDGTPKALAALGAGEILEIPGVGLKAYAFIEAALKEAGYVVEGIAVVGPEVSDTMQRYRFEARGWLAAQRQGSSA